MPLELESQQFFLFLIRDSIRSKMILILIKKWEERQFRRRVYSCVTGVNLTSSLLASWSDKISGTCMEWIFFLPSTWKTMASLYICPCVIIINAPGRRWIIDGFKMNLLWLRIIPVKTKSFDFLQKKKKKSFKWILLDLLRHSLGLSNINFFLKFSPLLSYKYSCLTQVASSSGPWLGMYLLNDA